MSLNKIKHAKIGNISGLKHFTQGLFSLYQLRTSSNHIQVIRLMFLVWFISTSVTHCPPPNPGKPHTFPWHPVQMWPEHVGSPPPGASFPLPDGPHLLLNSAAE